MIYLNLIVFGHVKSPDERSEESATWSSGTKWSEEVKFEFPINSTEGGVTVRRTRGFRSI